MSNYLDKKLREAYDYIKEYVGLKKYYSYFDAEKLLTSYGFTREISIEEINSYLPPAFPIYTSINEFSKGFLNDEDYYKIYAVLQGNKFDLIIISSKDGNLINNYYGNVINNFTMNIYCCLDIMCNSL